MEQQNNTADTSATRSVVRLCIALALGVAGSVGMWIATPYNNYLVENTYISETYMPLYVLAFMLALVLVVNPLLGLAGRKLMLSMSQLALVFAMLLVASAPNCTGFMRSLPYSLVGTARDAKNWKDTAELYRMSGLPRSLFLSAMKFQEPVPAVQWFIGKVPEGQAIPWGAWAAPAASWTVVIASMWALMMGISAIVYPQWRKNERLSFPLVTVQQALIEKEHPSHLFPAIIRSTSFWIGVSMVFLVYLLKGLNLYRPDCVPMVPVTWNFQTLFTEPPLLHLPDYVKYGQFFFAFIGIAYFMSNRVGVSLWFFPLAYAAWQVVMLNYAPTGFDELMPQDHRTGAMLALTAGILWLGRLHWKRVARCMVTMPASDEDRRDRTAGWLFTAGCIGMFAWLVWAGAQWYWAVVMVLILFIYTLLVTRVVAETGIMLIGFLPNHPTDLLRLLPVRLFKPATLWLYSMMCNFAYHTSEGSAAVLATQGMGLGTDESPRRTSRLAVLFTILLIGAVLIGGAAHLYVNYTNIRPLHSERETIGVRFWDCNDGLSLIKEAKSGTFNRPTYNRPVHVGFGIALAGTLQWICTMFPKWPIHPVGMLIAYSWWADQCWVSVFFGWLLKNIVLGCGGARLYHKGKSFFIGLIMGEFIAALFWTCVVLVRLAMGLPYEVVKVLPW